MTQTIEETCEQCSGSGVVIVFSDSAFDDPITMLCGSCEGRGTTISLEQHN